MIYYIADMHFGHENVIHFDVLLFQARYARLFNADENWRETGFS